MAVEHTLADRHEHTPDEDVLFAARHLDVGLVALSEADEIRLRDGILALLNVLIGEVEFEIGISEEVLKQHEISIVQIIPQPCHELAQVLIGTDAAHASTSPT